MNSKVILRRREWQEAVHKHKETTRDLRAQGRGQAEIQSMSWGSLMAVDVSYARLKDAEAEAELEQGTAALFKLALRPIVASA